MKPIFTPLDEYDEFLAGSGKTKIRSLTDYIIPFQKEFTRLDSLKLDLTHDAAFKFIDFDAVQPLFYRDLLQSGLLIDFDWKSWEEGEEILEGLRELQSSNPIKIFKLLTLIVRNDQKESGYFERMLKNRMIFHFLEQLDSLFP